MFTTNYHLFSYFSLNHISIMFNFSSMFFLVLIIEYLTFILSNIFHLKSINVLDQLLHFYLNNVKFNQNIIITYLYMYFQIIY